MGKRIEKTLKDKVEETILKYQLIEKGDKIVIGVSGGPDSLCMLFLLNEIRKEEKLDLKFDIVVAHINHGIRGKEADLDEEYVKDFCQKMQVEFFSKRIDIKEVAHNKKIGTEEAGREVRYDFFNEIRKKVGANKIAIAHHKNDKVETMLMNLLRGSGITGLKGIEPMKYNLYIRPLIECERQEIEKYCEENSLKPRIDSTNFENIYTRNKIRNVIIPYIQKEFNPNIIQTMDRLSLLVQEEEEYIEKKTKECYYKILLQEIEDEVVLDLKSFCLQEKVIKERILLYTIARILGNTNGISKIHIDDMIQLCNRNVGNKFLTPNSKIKFLIKNQKIFLIKQI